MTAEREQRLRLWDMIDAADKILERCSEGKQAFEHDEMLQVWVVHHLEVIGEAASNVHESIRGAHPEVDWIAATATRNRLAHGYFDIDLDVVWETVVRDVPLLRGQIASILESMEREDGR